MTTSIPYPKEIEPDNSDDANDPNTFYILLFQLC